MFKRLSVAVLALGLAATGARPADTKPALPKHDILFPLKSFH